jgi:hypothetical protein
MILSTIFGQRKDETTITYRAQPRQVWVEAMDGARLVLDRCLVHCQSPQQLAAFANLGPRNPCSRRIGVSIHLLSAHHLPLLLERARRGSFSLLRVKHFV